MNNQAENYIILKPIAERFNRIANDMTDDEIRYIISAEIKEQIRRIDFTLGIESYLDDHQEEISEMCMNSIRDRLR